MGVERQTDAQTEGLRDRQVKGRRDKQAGMERNSPLDI
jgi:hypothetical protein